MRFIAVLIVSLLAVVPAAATIVLPASLDELAADADAIVLGRVIGIEARQRETLRVERIVTLHVVRYFKGDWGSTVRFRVPGGTFGRYRTVTPGAPEFSEGDEVLLFLGSHGAALPHVTGFNQGVLRIVHDAPTGSRVVLPPLVQPADEPQRLRRGDADRRPLRLDEFEGRLAELLAAQRADKRARR